MSDPLGKVSRLYVTDHKLINDFAEDMFAKMRKNCHKAHWNTVSQEWLFERMCEEVKELESAMTDESICAAEIIQECADVANFSAMIADNVRNR